MRFVNGVLWVLIVIGLGAIAWWFIRGPFISPRQQVVEGTSAVSSVAASSPTAYALGTHDGSHVRWNPCDGPIAVRINYGGLAEESHVAAKKAVANGLKAARTATGLEFDYRGATTDPFPTADSDTRRTDDNAIVIAFLPNDRGLLRRTGQPLGIKRVVVTDDTSGALHNLSSAEAHDASASASASTPASPIALAEWRVIVGGDVQVAVPASGTPKTDLVEPVLIGLAAVLGLDPTPQATTDNVMASQADPGLTGYGPGDRAGLAEVGASAGCLDAPE